MTGTITIGSSDFTVALDDLADAVSAIGVDIGSISSSVGAINNLLNQIAETWGGPASLSYMSLHPQITQEMSKMLTALGEIHSGLNTSHQNYLDMETTNTRILEPTAFLHTSGPGQQGTAAPPVGHGTTQGPPAQHQAAQVKSGHLLHALAPLTPEEPTGVLKATARFEEPTGVLKATARFEANGGADHAAG